MNHYPKFNLSFLISRINKYWFPSAANIYDVIKDLISIVTDCYRLQNFDIHDVFCILYKACRRFKWLLHFFLFYWNLWNYSCTNSQFTNIREKDFQTTLTSTSCVGFVHPVLKFLSAFYLFDPSRLSPENGKKHSWI